jgi:hypothetical protein
VTVVSIVGFVEIDLVGHDGGSHPSAASLQV